MTKTQTSKSNTIPRDLIAPCGMNCRLCWGFIRETNRCPGCLNIEKQESKKSKYRNSCKIRNCDQLAKGNNKYCSEGCKEFPCTRLKQLDKRYRSRYGMSMIENLKMIDEFGIRHFINKEKKKWICPECGEMICAHKPACLTCGYKWL